MSYSKYTPQEIAYLINSPDEFIKIHELDRNNAITLRRYYIKELSKIGQGGETSQNVEDIAKILQPLGNVNPDDYEVGFHRGYIKNSEGEIELTPPLYSIKPKKGTTSQKLSDFISQADPIHIKVSKQKPAKRDHKLIFVFSDSQIDYREIDGELKPVHDESALKVMQMICEDYQPDTIVNLGDTIDLAALSRFDKDSTHFDHSMQPAFNRVHRLYAELRQDNQHARIVEVDSNHNTRLKKFMLNNASQLYGLKQAGADDTDYPVFSYPFLTNLKAANIEWVSGYGAAEFVYGEEYNAPPIVFKHGTLVGQNVANKEAAHNPYTHIVRGHTHRPESANRTMRDGKYLTYMIVGVTCSITGDVPSVYSAVDDRGQVVKNQEQWQQSVALIHDYQDGTYQFDNIMINKGIAKFNGKVYAA